MIKNINHITLAVQDIARSFTFYQEILGLKPLCKWDKGAYFLVGEFWFCLNVDEKREKNPCYTHYAFSVDLKDFAAMAERIKRAGVIIFKNNISEGKSLYFLDPDGHKLEIHVGGWQERIDSKKRDIGNWKEVEWY